MSTPESYIHDQNADIRAEIMAGLMWSFRSEIGLVRFPIQQATDEVPAGPLPVLGGFVPHEAADLWKNLPSRHYGITHQIVQEQPRYTVDTFLPHTNPDLEQGRSRFVLTPDSGMIAV